MNPNRQYSNSNPQYGNQGMKFPQFSNNQMNSMQPNKNQQGTV